ncbi:MAG: NAD(P)-binding domain-containing protein [Gemmatimonadota bacterium]|jgi:predicted dinucleotide-binding enzyme
MKIGVLGSGNVGRTIAGKLILDGHDVMVGTRDPAKLADWLAGEGEGGRAGSPAETAAHGELLFNATPGSASIEALRAAGAANIAGKILIDLANPLDFSQGMPPSLTVCNTDSLGERIQAAFPEARVVKALNTVNLSIMVDPQGVANGDHHLFVCGNDEQAKAAVTTLLRDEFGWTHIIDLGDITNARGTEMYLAIWIRLMNALGTARFNIRVTR